MTAIEAAESVTLQTENSNSTKNAIDTTVATPDDVKKRQYKKRPNYALIHKDLLPLTVYPLPVFHPTNPLSLLSIAWTVCKHFISPPQSQPPQRYIGYLSTDTRSIHITDRAHIRALWERGFFGKGLLSRSEPSWIDREKARLEARAQGGLTAEENTKARREARRMFKLERARAEADKIELQRAIEQASKTDEHAATKRILTDNATDTSEHGQHSQEAGSLSTERSDIQNPDETIEIKDQEHLQLTLEEAFFLKYGLGVLDIYANGKQLDGNARSLFDSFRLAAKLTPSPLAMDDGFILNYVVYHHFRSLGWVVRPGIKFSVDYMLYYRGPALSHAEFSIIIMPSYSDPFWLTLEGKKLKQQDDQKDWWWFHCLNRVQSQVMKTLVLCYVDIPPPLKDGEHLSIRKFLGRYKIREFIVRRWLMNRSRD